MTDIPSTLKDVTADWLADQIRAVGHEVPDITSLEQAPMDGFVGALGEVAILSVSWADDDPQLPGSFVAKCPLDDDMARLYNSVMQYYVRESGFYRDLVDEVDMVTPQCWANRYDPDSGNAFLLLEHVTDAVKGDILEGCSPATMRTLVGDLARMHGKFWMNERLLEIDWLLDWTTDTFELGIEITQQSWRDLAETEPDRYPPDIFEILEKTWINNTVEWLARYAQRPWTLTHIDYELDNILIADTGPIILDWQSPMRSHPGVDLAWLLATSHNAETLALEPELLDHYRAELVAAGGPQWSAAELEHELAWGIIFPAACQPIPYLQDTGTFGEGGGRMHDRFERFLSGSVEAAVRWNLVDHIGPLI